MSGLLQGLVYFTDLPSHLKITLGALADQANDDGSGIWIGQRLLAFKVGATDRTVRENLKKLRADGWIEREARSSAWGTDRYRIVVARLPSSDDVQRIKAELRGRPEDVSGRKDLPPGSGLPVAPEVGFRSDRKRASANTSLRPKTSYTGDFLEIWNLYPPRNGRREKKQEAAAEWAKLRPSEELRATIVRAIRALHGATETPVDLCRYLKHRRWEDETVAGRAAAGPPPAPVAKPADGGVMARLQREGVLPPPNGVDHARGS